MLCSFLFSSVIDQSNRLCPASDPNVIESNNRTNGSPPYPGQPSGSFWYGLEPGRPRCDWFRSTCPLFHLLKVWTSRLFLLFLKNRQGNHAQIVDLAISYKFVKSRALYDQIWPTWWQNKAATFTKGANQAYPEPGRWRPPTKAWIKREQSRTKLWTNVKHRGSPHIHYISI